MKILVPEIHCGGCVKRINAALQEAGYNAVTDQESKTVTLEAAEADFAKIAGILDDLGFSAEKQD